MYLKTTMETVKKKNWDLFWDYRITFMSIQARVVSTTTEVTHFPSRHHSSCGFDIGDFFGEGGSNALGILSSFLLDASLSSYDCRFYLLWVRLFLVLSRLVVFNYRCVQYLIRKSLHQRHPVFMHLFICIQTS